MGSSYTQCFDQRDQHDRFVGGCPTLEVKMNGVDVKCLIDTGSMVTTVTEEFFKKYLKPEGATLVTKGLWLTLTCASGLKIPYIGYLELDIEIGGIILPQMGILVVADTPTCNDEHRQQKRLVPVVLGMNVLKLTIENNIDIIGLPKQSLPKTVAHSALVHTTKSFVFIPAQSCATVLATTLSDYAVVEPLPLL